MPAGILLFGGMAVLALFWVIRDLRSGRRREALPWTRKNTVFSLALTALLPVQFVLLRFGEPHGITDQIGVVLTILQWVLIGTALRPRTPRLEWDRNQTAQSRFKLTPHAPAASDS